jgi:PAS domain S-box-containing protein
MSDHGPGLSKLRESEATYRGLFDALDDGFCILERATGELDFRYVAANPAFETQSGLVGVTGRTLREVIPDEPGEWYAIYDEVLKTGEPIRFQRTLGDSGRELEVFAVRIAAGVRDRLAVVFRDVTERMDTAARERAALAEQSQVAVTLQRAILGPGTLPEGFAVRYEPATLQVGGDWYDVVNLANGRYGVVVGDVVGQGLDAAAIMGQLRSAARALLLEDHGPAKVVSSLDGFAALLPGARCTTIFCAIIDPERATVDYSSAGHLPAIMVHPDGGHALLDQALSPPLAVIRTAIRTEATTTLPTGSSLLLYTDGLVERRGEVLDTGLNRAINALTTYRDFGLEDAITRTLRDLTGSGHDDDDVALLLYRQSSRVKPETATAESPQRQLRTSRRVQVSMASGDQVEV